MYTKYRMGARLYYSFISFKKQSKSCLGAGIIEYMVLAVFLGVSFFIVGKTQLGLSLASPICKVSWSLNGLDLNQDGEALGWNDYFQVTSSLLHPSGEYQSETDLNCDGKNSALDILSYIEQMEQANLPSDVPFSHNGNSYLIGFINSAIWAMASPHSEMNDRQERLTDLIETLEDAVDLTITQQQGRCELSIRVSGQILRSISVGDCPTTGESNSNNDDGFIG